MPGGEGQEDGEATLDEMYWRRKEVEEEGGTISNQFLELRGRR
jgi:hypothetical protein